MSTVDAITFNTIHKLINIHVESLIAQGEFIVGEQSQDDLRNIISLCHDLQYHIESRTGVGY